MSPVSSAQMVSIDEVAVSPTEVNAASSVEVGSVVMGGLPFRLVVEAVPGHRNRWRAVPLVWSGR